MPRLLDLFAKEGVKATFFFSLGPDTSGKAIKRIFRKGFVKKVLSASPAASYGLKTMLYGTLLPAPDIGGRTETVARMREAAQAGHSVGIHAWDHIDWHDRLPAMTREEIEGVVAKEHARFLEIFGAPAAFQAAPGWTATPLSVEVQERARHPRDVGHARRGAVLRAAGGRDAEPGAGDPEHSPYVRRAACPLVARGRLSGREGLQIS